MHLDKMITSKPARFPSDFLVCPLCSSTFRRVEDRVQCPGGHQFPVLDEIPVLTKNTAYHFLSPTKEQIEIATRIMDEKGFASGMDWLMREVGADNAREVCSYMMGEDRAAWKLLLPELASKRVLDYGCGWGNLATSLARSAGTVYGMDLSLQRVRFARRRADYEGLENLHFVAGGDEEKLPFADASFDVVVLNGILEWIPTSRGLNHGAREAQLSFLREIARVTGPHGTVCLAIENRCGIKYFWGTKDEHSGLRFITLLPRLLADVYSRRRRGINFREYTHTIFGYKKLLHEAGFSHFDPYIPFPSYRYYDVVSAYKRPAGISELLGPRRKLIRLTAKLTERLPFFANAFFMMGSKKPVLDAPLLDELTRASGPYSACNEKQFRVLGTGSVLVYAREKQQGKEVVLKFPLTPKAAASNAEAFQNLELLRQSNEIPAWLKPLLATPLQHTTVCRHQCFVQSRLTGMTGSELAANPALRDTILNEAVTLLGRLHRETAHLREVTPDLFDQGIKVLAARSFSQFARLENGSQLLAKLEGQLRQAFLGSSLRLVLCHGDFWLKNILFDPVSLQPTGIVDWDRFLLPGPPFVDLINLLLMTHRRTGELRTAIMETLEKTNHASAPGVLQYLEELKLDSKQMRNLAALCLLQRLPEEKLAADKEDFDTAMDLLK